MTWYLNLCNFLHQGAPGDPFNDIGDCVFTADCDRQTNQGETANVNNECKIATTHNKQKEPLSKQKYEKVVLHNFLEISKNLFPQLIDLRGPLRHNQIRKIMANIENFKKKVILITGHNFDLDCVT